MAQRITYDKKMAWEIIYSRYEGMQAKALQLLSAEIGYRVLRDPAVYTLYVLPVSGKAVCFRKNVPSSSDTGRKALCCKST